MLWLPLKLVKYGKCANHLRKLINRVKKQRMDCYFKRFHEKLWTGQTQKRTTCTPGATFQWTSANTAERLILSTGWQACVWLHHQHRFGLEYQRSGLLSHVVFKFGTDIVLTCRSNCSPTTFDCNPSNHDCGARVRRGCYTTTTTTIVD